jgi:hypothetical protein
MTKRIFAYSLGVLFLANGLLAQPRRVNVTLRGFENLVMLDTLASWSELLAPPAQAYAAAKQVLDSLKLSPTASDSANGLLLNRGFVARGRIAGRRMSWAWRCGSGLVGDYADTWRISMAYALFIDPSNGGGSRLGVAFAAGADDVQGASKAPLQCGTTGLLEKEIAKLVALKLIK